MADMPQTQPENSEPQAVDPDDYAASLETSGDIDSFDEPEESQVDPDALEALEDGQYTPEMVEELRQRLELAESLVDWEKVTNPEEEAAPAVADNAVTSIEDAFTPKQFTYTDDELDDILTEGNGETLVGLLERQAQVIQHNSKIETVNLVARMLEGRLPLAVATNNFYERYPELSGPKGEEIVSRTFDAVWAQNPKQTSVQLLRATEKRLSQVIAKAKEIAKHGGQRHNLTTRNAGSTALGTTPQARRAPAQRTNNASSLAAIGYNLDD